MVPKRRPPSPHSCNRSRSPLRHRAAAKPSQVIKANSATKMIKAIQFASCTALLPNSSPYCFVVLSFCVVISAGALLVGHEVDNCGQDGSKDDPEQLVPVEEREADQGRLGCVVEGRPENSDELNEEEQIPPAPSGTFLVVLVADRFFEAVA